MPLSLQLRVDERLDDRIHVSVALAPEDAPHHIDGAAVELITWQGERLSHRVMLPISGTIGGPIATRVELRCMDAIPYGAMVRGTAWWGSEQLEVTISAELFTGLESHARGTPHIALADALTLDSLTAVEREALGTHFPWTHDFKRPGSPPEDDEPNILDETTEEERIDDFCDELGLDAESAEWLRELLDEDET